jgi:hypothetical protein
MSNKEIVEDLLTRLPENASLHDIAREIEFVAGVREGLDELDRGERIPVEEVEAEFGHSGKSRLARECAKLSATEEQALADEGLSADAREWPAY